MVLRAASLMNNQFLFHIILQHFSFDSSVFLFPIDTAGAASATASATRDPRNPETQKPTIQHGSKSAGCDRAGPGRASDRLIVDQSDQSTDRGEQDMLDRFLFESFH